MTAMRKLDIARRIHTEAGISEEQAIPLLNWVVWLFKSTLQKGESISIANFGVFAVRQKAARNGRNPSTGEAVMIPARRVVTFRANLQLKAEVNSAQSEQHEAEGLLPKGK
jgi:nucleoid DNA-binding protein